jgi:hypothetical protein
MLSKTDNLIYTILSQFKTRHDNMNGCNIIAEYDVDMRHHHQILHNLSIHTVLFHFIQRKSSVPSIKMISFQKLFDVQ